MGRAILLVFEEDNFHERLKEKLKGLRPLLTASNIQELEEICANRVIEVALLDMTQKGSDALGKLAILQQRQPGVQVILITSQENITVAMEGMRQGASDEITVPFEVKSLQQKIKAAQARRQASARSGTRGSIRKAIEKMMIAATFAQAGEFDTARETLLEKPPGEKGKKK